MGMIILVTYILAVLAIYLTGGVLIGISVSCIKDNWESGYKWVSVVLVLVILLVIGCLVVMTWLNIEIVRIGNLKEIITFLNSGL